jgi:pimeloyl-ACP methyl ester carboxylesterase
MNAGVELKFTRFGNPKGPMLVCVPGLLGGPEDFTNIIPPLFEKFQILIVNPIAHARESGLKNLSADVLSEVSYDSTSTDIFENLQREFKSEAYYFMGISLGGKVVYDFAIRYPQAFRGGLITDVGLSSFESSPLFKFVLTTVEGIDLSMPWPEMKAFLRKNIPENNLRVLIQTQVSYPDAKPPAKWKVGMQNFKELLQGHAIDEQHEDYLKVDAVLAKNGSIIHVLKAETLSGICPEGFDQMQDLKSIKFHNYADTAHFLHITHKEQIQEIILKHF